VKLEKKGPAPIGAGPLTIGTAGYGIGDCAAQLWISPFCWPVIILSFFSALVVCATQLHESAVIELLSAARRGLCSALTGPAGSSSH
jgi:hypothetical protein